MTDQHHRAATVIGTVLTKVNKATLLPHPTEAGMRGAYVEVHCGLVYIRHGWKHLQPGAAAGQVCSALHELHVTGTRASSCGHLQCTSSCWLYAGSVCWRALLRLRCEQMNVGASRVDRSPVFAWALRHHTVGSATCAALCRAPEQTSELASAQPARPPS